MDKIINKDIDKIKEKSVKNIMNNYYSNYEDEKYIPFEKMDSVDIADLYEQQYNFNNDDSILDSVSKI